MKRTLHESLVDCDMALLRAMAETRGAILTSNHRLTAAEELASQLTTPASLAIALSELSAQETEPLAALQAAGGWMEAPRFARRSLAYCPAWRIASRAGSLRSVATSTGRGVVSVPMCDG